MICIHKMTMMSSSKYTLSGQYCQCLVVMQQIVSNISILRIYSLCSESNNTIVLLCLLIAVLGASVLLHTSNVPSPTTYICSTVLLSIDDGSIFLLDKVNK